MPDKSPYDRLREAGWRRPLTAGERAELREWLAAHPEVRTDWELEAGLSEALRGMQGAPVPSNFTARVLQAVNLEELRVARAPARPLWVSWVSGWLPRTALAGLFVLSTLASYHYAEAKQRVKMAQSVVRVSEALPSAEMLENFDAIRALNPTPAADGDLLALLK